MWGHVNYTFRNFCLTFLFPLVTYVRTTFKVGSICATINSQDVQLDSSHTHKLITKKRINGSSQTISLLYHSTNIPQGLTPIERKPGFTKPKNSLLFWVRLSQETNWCRVNFDAGERLLFSIKMKCLKPSFAYSFIRITDKWIYSNKPIGRRQSNIEKVSQRTN